MNLSQTKISLQRLIKLLLDVYNQNPVTPTQALKAKDNIKQRKLKHCNFWEKRGKAEKQYKTMMNNTVISKRNFFLKGIRIGKYEQKKGCRIGGIKIPDNETKHRKGKKLIAE